jgi:hypothetical protein
MCENSVSMPVSSRWFIHPFKNATQKIPANIPTAVAAIITPDLKGFLQIFLHATDKIITMSID